MKRTYIFLMAFLFFIAPFSAIADEARDSFSFSLGEGISLNLTTTQFNEKNHKITECNINDRPSVCLIDGKPIFGTDLDLPRNQLVKATIKIGKNTINLDVTCMYNPWFGKPDVKKFTLKKAYGGYLISGYFSDGAGSYEAEWFVIENSAVRTRLVKGEC